MSKHSTATAPERAADRGIPQRLVDALIDCLGADERTLTLDSRLVEDLGADSLDIVELQLDLEQRLHVDTPEMWIDDEVMPTLTVRSILRDLTNHGAKL